ncbi:MAG TPA: Rieske (2Fe-2S) protein, partial [Acetobacteraceae bacterium]|nr:Rieske (2Fe-2S) protein [Acetobacteraceae bacterium]
KDQASPQRTPGRRSVVQEIFVTALEDVPDRGRLVFKCGDTEVGIFRLGDEVHAWQNRCAHQGGPVCQGRLFAKVLEPVGADRTVSGMRYSDEDLHIVCPWHGYEYNVRTGRNAGHPDLHLQRVDAVVRDGNVYVRV